MKSVSDEAYRRHLHEQDCRCCGTDQGCQAAHHGHAKGMGLKQPISWCTSLCPTCHREYDTWPAGKADWWYNKVTIPEDQRAHAEWMLEQ